jgi:DNA repair protein RadC
MFDGLQTRVQLVREGNAKYKKVSCSTDVVSLIRDIHSWDREVFLTLSLTTKNNVVGIEVTAIGSLDSAAIAPREVFKGAFLSNAYSIIIAHLHPSGDPTPSTEDVAFTRRLHKCGELLGVPVFDHIIVTESGGYFSFLDSGLLERIKE